MQNFTPNSIMPSGVVKYSSDLNDLIANLLPNNAEAFGIRDEEIAYKDYLWFITAPTKADAMQVINNCVASGGLSQFIDGPYIDVFGWADDDMGECGWILELGISLGMSYKNGTYIWAVTCDNPF